MLSAEAISFHQQSRLAISLSWIGGFTNVVAFLTWRVFASHVTGASTLLGLGGATLNLPDIRLYATLVSSFLAGAMASALFTELLARRNAHSRYVLPLTVEAVLLTLLLIALSALPNPQAPLPRDLLLGLTAFTMGLQNATITRISGAVIRSTHLTGVVTDIGIESVRLLLWAWDQTRGRPWTRAARVLRLSQRHPHLLRLALLASIWGSFVLGTIIGTLAYSRIHQYCLLAPIAFLLVITLLNARKRPTATP